MGIDVKEVKAMKMTGTNWKKVLDGIDEIVEVLTKLDSKGFTVRRNICGVGIISEDKIISDNVKQVKQKIPSSKGYLSDITNEVNHILVLVNSIENNIDCVAKGCNPPQKQQQQGLCPNCRGTGLVDGTMKQCQRCNGEGTIEGGSDGK